MTHLDHYEHIDSREKGVYTLRFLIAALGNDKNAHNLTCDELDRRTRGCPICMGELFAEQAMFHAEMLKALAEQDSTVDGIVAIQERELAGLLDAGQP